MADAKESLKSLRTAIEIEDNGLMTFLKFARETQVATGKNMFIRLAMDEHVHRKILDKQLSRLMEGEKWEAVEVPRSEIERIAPAIREKQQKTKGESGLAELDALKTALDLERKAAKFFREQAELVSEPEAKNMFLRLADWEDSHFDLIQAELDHINQTGFWMGIPEFKMDGKY
ncbi:MAG: ferritin family protein [Candidatus Eiseniibacteriota bacterium]|nr:MAG: ferritin family protein [Candidatus Eisenbacteria bacterium]